jgi:hypothetical protein
MVVAALHGPVGEFVEIVGPETEADPAALVVDALVLAGHSIGRTAHVRVGGAVHHPNLFAVVVGPSGAAGRKGTAYTEARALFALADQGAVNRVLGGVVSGEGIIWAVRDPIFERDKKSGEDVQVDPGVADKRLLLRESEFCSVLRVAGRDSNTTSGVLRQAWDDGRRLETLAKTSPAVASNAHISMAGDITPDELRRELTATDRANGFGNRILWCCSKRSKELPSGGNVDEGKREVLAGKIRDVLAGRRQLGRVDFDHDAFLLWSRDYSRLTRERRGLIGALLARAEPQVVRLAVVYAVLDGAQEVHEEHLEAALAVWDYCERSAYYIFGTRTGDPIADEIHHALVRAAPDGLRRTEIRDLFGRHRHVGDLDRALALLEREGLAWTEQEATGGRPAERWYATTEEQEES